MNIIRDFSRFLEEHCVEQPNIGPHFFLGTFFAAAVVLPLVFPQWGMFSILNVMNVCVKSSDRLSWR